MYLDTKMIIQNRKVYSFMNFLEDVGGIQASLMSIGIFFHFFITGNDQAQQLLKHFFRVNLNSSNKINFDSNSELKDWQTLKMNKIDTFLFGTIFRYLICLCRCFKVTHRNRIKQLLKRTEQQVEQALDVRTLFRMQSLLYAHT